MSTITTIKQQIQKLISLANAKTGNDSNANLTSAVMELIDGYGGGSAGATIDTCTVTLYFSNIYNCAYTFVDESGNLNTATTRFAYDIFNSNICCNSLIVFEVEDDPMPGEPISGAEVIFNVTSGSRRYIAFKITAEPGENAHLGPPT